MAEGAHRRKNGICKRGINQPRSQGFSLGDLARAGKDPGIGWSREYLKYSTGL